VILGSSEPAERYLMKRIIGMAEVDFAQFWIGQVFRGEVAAPPHIAPTPSEARRFVAAHPYALGFVEAGDLDDSVKALTVDGRRFDQPGYTLVWAAEP
jgi:hypothetical protein